MNVSDNTAKSYSLITLGCAKNQVDSAAIRRALATHGVLPCDDPEKADYLILNTCGFITPAKQESIETVLELAGIKELRPGTRLIMAGCFVQRNSAELEAELPEVDAFFGTDCAVLLAENIDRNGNFVRHDPPEPVYRTACGTSPAEGPNAYYVKISEGCDNRCSYCAIPLIRGGYRPRPAREILQETAALLAAKAGEPAFAEINLISQDTSRYYDPENPDYRLEDLLDDIEAQQGVPRWIRALYLHPASLRPELIRRMCRPDSSVLPYFDIPVQHLSDRMLQLMNRRHDWAHLQQLIQTVRESSPDAVLRTTLIVGHPGETAEDHRILLQRLEQIRFDKLGAFVYSEEDGTAAASMPEAAVEKITARRRFNRIMTLQKKLSAAALSRFLDRTIPVLIEEAVAGEPGLYIGRGPHDAPDVDGAVVVQAPPDCLLTPGLPASVRIVRTMDYDLYGELL